MLGPLARRCFSSSYLNQGLTIPQPRSSARGDHWIGLEVQSRTQDEGRVEIQFRVQGAFYVLLLAETVLFAIEQEVSNGNSPVLQAVNHQLCLVERYDFVLRTLKEDHRHGEAIDVVDRRAIH